MSTREEQIRNQRLETLKKIREMGIDPYPSKGKRTHLCNEVKDKFKSLKGKNVSVVGRIMTDRNMGKIAFFTIKDVSGTLQIVFRQDNIGKDKQKYLKIFDTGDFIEVTGKVMKTKVGEVSVDVKNFKLLAKALMPLPDKFSGLKDEELKLRKRYLDILLDDEVRKMFVKRSDFWQAMRDFLKDNGFIEVETPVLETTAGGADARPFITHHNALGIDTYLRISAGELWQKRLMVAGFEKTFEIGRIFRNEGMSFEHLQDYTQMEFYWAYADYNDGMKLVEKLYKHLAREVFGTYKFQIGDYKVDLGKKWEVYSYPLIIKKVTGVNIANTNITEVKNKLRDLKVRYDAKGLNLIRGIDLLWKHCRKKISGPGFLIDVPVDMEPLAKRKTDDQGLVQRFQVLLAGSEVGKGYSELNDPIDQAERFSLQQKMRDAGDEEAQMFDKDFVEALEIGMPPTCGFGVSERLFSFLMDKPSREAQIFPLMRPEKGSGALGYGKTKDTNISVAVINKGQKLEKWQEMNTIAHLNASHAARGGKGLVMQDTIDTKDGNKIKLNVQHAIMIKEAKTNKEMLDLIKKARDKGLEVVEFMREMIVTSDDNKLMEMAKKQNMNEINFLGVLVYGKKSVVEKLTEKFGLSK